MSGPLWNFEGSRFSYVPIAADDLDQLYAWLKRPHVAEWWDIDPKAEFLRDKQQQIMGDVWNGFVVHKQLKPVCYIETWRQGLSDEPWWPGERHGMVSVDMFIIDPADLYRGLGSKILADLAVCVLRDKDIDLVTIDPQPGNAAAIRCYQKAGFRVLGVYPTPDGPSLYLVKW